MWPRYPRFARRSGTSRHADSAACGSKRGAVARFGPIPAKPISTAATSAHAEATSSEGRQPKPPNALNRYGDADPSVSAPTRMPTISPMSPLAHVEASFMPIG